ncbi:MAG: peptidase MA family metallohydrolase [Anaerolineae bacterium]|mgnify:CR=1 FL=1
MGLASGVSRNRVRRKTGALLGLLLILAVSIAPVYAQAAVVAEHTYTYSQVATFTLTFPPEAAPASATLYLKVGTFTQLYPTPVIGNVARLERNLSEAPFPPFTQISYAWEYQDAQGRTLSTETHQFLYEDNRFAWETLHEDNITLHWVAGDKVLMSNALDIAQTAIAEIQQTLDAPVIDAATLYIYPSLPDLQSALLLTGYEWVGGKAYPEIGVVLLAISPSSEAILKMKRDIPHELTHKVLYDLTGAQGYAAQPTWFVEGLASTFERSPDPAYALALQRAAQDGKLIPLTTLCNPFPAEADRAILAYAQSQSFVRYLQQTYGWSKIRQLIDAYADGLECSAGVKQTLGADLTTLERDWRVWMERKNQDSAVSATWTYVATVVRDLAPWLILVGLLCVPIGVLWLGTRFGQ